MLDHAKIAVIGAGPAGLACATSLRAHGVRATIYEKSRGIGGRVATRRRNGFQFDHGAQFLWVDADDPVLAAARGAGGAAPWGAAVTDDGVVPWVGTPRMKDVLRPLAAGYEIRFSSEVVGLLRKSAGWSVETTDGAEIYASVAIAAPAPQILRFLDGGEHALRHTLARVAFEPSHALMIAFDERPNWPDIIRDPPGPFALLVRDTSKPGRLAPPETFVAHTTPAWSAGWVDADAGAICEELKSALRTAMGPLPTVLYASAHRWRFSQAIEPLGAPFAATTDGSVLAGGDWALGRNIEQALQSGRAMAQSIVERLGD